MKVRKTITHDRMQLDLSDGNGVAHLIITRSGAKVRSSPSMTPTADKLSALYLTLQRSGLDNGEIFNRLEAEFANSNGEGR